MPKAKVYQMSPRSPCNNNGKNPAIVVSVVMKMGRSRNKTIHRSNRLSHSGLLYDLLIRVIVVLLYCVDCVTKGDSLGIRKYINVPLIAPQPVSETVLIF